jgi:hypothetical protein
MWTIAGLFLMAVIGIGLLAKALYPIDLPPTANPDFVDNVFDNRAVLWAARMLLMSAAGVLTLGGIFIAASIGIRMKNGEWLRRAGPFEISEKKLNRAEDEIDFWRRTALSNQEEIAGLEFRLQQSDELISTVKSMK